MKLAIPLLRLKDKRFSYIIYSWMMLNSKRKKNEKEFRYIKTKDIIKNHIFKSTSLTRPTINTKLEYLLNENEIVKANEEYINLYKTNNFVLIDEEILRMLIKDVDESSLRFYLVLLKYNSYAKNEKLFVSLKTISEELGMSTTNRSKVAKYHKTLSAKGFITVNQKRFSEIKTKNFYILHKVDEIYRGSVIEEKAEEQESHNEQKTKIIKISLPPLKNSRKKRELQPIDMNSFL